ncbi:MAG: transposase [Bacteroidota bacterium]|nr:transposase [Bacteroidota bacterium]
MNRSINNYLNKNSLLVKEKPPTTVIHSVEFTPAHVHDTDKFDDLLTDTERRALADKGYRNMPLTKKQRKRNKLLSAVRPASAGLSNPLHL